MFSVMAKIQARQESPMQWGIPTAPTRACPLSQGMQSFGGAAGGNGWWVQRQSWTLLICFMGSLPMCQSKGKSLSKLPCRIQHIHLHLPAHSLCCTCPVSGGRRAQLSAGNSPTPPQVGFVCWVSAQPCPDTVSSCCRSQMRAAQPLYRLGR